MSIIAKKKHGANVKCGGPGMCSDCSPMPSLNFPDVDLDCPYHDRHSLKPSPHDKTVFICSLCKNEKVPGKDGIYSKEDLYKILKKHNASSNSLSKAGEKQLSTGLNNIFDDYDGYY